jgi:pimeloyl-ACP methyl ester carboxylesterase
VVLVHGFVGRGSDFRRLRRALQDAGRPTCAPDLGWTSQGVASYAPPLEAALEQASAAGPVDVVAHSMGALVLRTVLAERPDLASAVHRVVTLGAPHSGTASARGLPAGQPRDLDDLKRSSAFLAQLPDLTALVDPERVVTIAGTHDLVVYPPQTCHAPGAHAIDLPLGHSELLMAPAAVGRVLDALQAP